MDVTLEEIQAAYSGFTDSGFRLADDLLQKGLIQPKDVMGIGTIVNKASFGDKVHIAKTG